MRTTRFQTCLALVALSASLGLGTAASAAPDLLLGSGSATPGGTVLLPLSHVGGPDIVALQVDVVHDAGVLSLQDAAPGAALSGSDHELAWHLVAPGRVRIVVFSRTNAPLPGGVLATLRLRIAAGAPLGVQAVQVEAVELVSSLAAVVAPDLLASGSVSILPCLPGDVFPAGVGDATLDLRDFVQALRDLSAGTATGGRYAACGDLAGGSLACTAAAPESWCPSGDGGSFTLADALVLRRLAAGTARLSCATCPSLPLPAAAPLPGDLALPALLVDVSDVLRILRAAVGLDLLSAEQRLAADVAPADPEVNGLRSVRGDGAVDVTDVLIVLRVAVGLERIGWPARTLILSLAQPASFVAFSATLTGLPSYAGSPTMEGANCANAEGSGVDSSVRTWAFTCVSDPTQRSGVTGPVATFRYRSPRAIEASAITLKSQLVDAALVSTEGLLSLSAGEP